MHAADDRAEAPRSTLAARNIGLFALALGLGLGSSLLAGDLEHLWWHAGTLAAAFTVLFAVRFSPRELRRLLYIAAICWGAGLAAATLWAGYETLAGFATRGRSSLFFANPNLLGSSLTMAGTVLLLLTGRTWAASSILVFAPALLLTGSRTALVAYLSAWSLWLLLNLKTGRLYLFGGTLLVLGVTLWLGISSGSQKAQKNLLVYSDTLTHSAWTGRYAAALKLEQVPAVAPGERSERSKVFRQKGRSDPRGAHPTFVLIQNAHRSEVGVPYVASAYLRADRPQTVRFKYDGPDL